MQGIERHYYQVRDLDGKAKSYNYLPEDFSPIPADDTPQVSPYDKEGARTMIQQRLIKPPTLHVRVSFCPPSSLILTRYVELPFRCSPDEGQVSYDGDRLYVQGMAPSHVPRGGSLLNACVEFIPNGLL